MQEAQQNIVILLCILCVYAVTVVVIFCFYFVPYNKYIAYQVYFAEVVGILSVSVVRFIFWPIQSLICSCFGCSAFYL